MSPRILVLTVALVACANGAFSQQPLRLQIAAGRVTLHAQNIPVRTILAEWSRLGGARIVNGDRVVGSAVTLDLDNVPERQALDIILRGVSGYVLAAREPGAAVGASMFDRIMILPTSTAPRNPPPTAAAPLLANPTAALVRPVPPRVPDDQDGDDIDVGAGNNDGVPIARPVPIQRPAGTPVFPPPAPIGVVDDTPPQPVQPPQSGVVVTPSNPFGMPPGSSARPGVISPAPQAPQQAPPRAGPQN